MKKSGIYVIILIYFQLIVVLYVYLYCKLKTDTLDAFYLH